MNSTVRFLISETLDNEGGLHVHSSNQNAIPIQSPNLLINYRNGYMSTWWDVRSQSTLIQAIQATVT